MWSLTSQSPITEMLQGSTSKSLRTSTNYFFVVWGRGRKLPIKKCHKPVWKIYLPLCFTIWGFQGIQCIGRCHDNRVFKTTQWKCKPVNYRCAQCMLLSQLFHKGMYIDACVLNKKLIDIYILLTCTRIFLHVHLIMKIRNMVKKYALFQLKLSKI